MPLGYFFIEQQKMMNRVQKSAGMTRGLCRHNNKQSLAQKGAAADTKHSEVLSSSQLARASDALPARNYCSFIIALNPESEKRSTKHVHKTSHLHNLHCYSCPVRPRQPNSFASAQPCPALVCSGYRASDSRSSFYTHSACLWCRIGEPYPVP